MVAIFTGAGTGFERGSGSALGSSGLLGSASVGRGGEQLLLNAATGNLLISRQDEFLVGRGPDVAVSRTYNSLGDGSDDNGDNWLQSTDRKLFGFDGALNAVGSVVKRRAADGSVVTYVSDGTAYRATNSAGIHDKVTYDGSWHWSSEDGRIVEDYGYWVNGYVITRQTDATSGDSLTFTYSGDKLTTVTTADGGQIQYSWSGNHITQVVSGDGTATRYYYDSYDRLSRVDTELTGGGSVYSLFYTYDGSSKRVASLAQTDGSRIEFTYAQIGGDYRVTAVKQWVDEGVSRTTRIDYDLANRVTTVIDPAGVGTRFYYDSVGKLTRLDEAAAGPGAAEHITTFQYSGDDLEAVRGYDGAAKLATNSFSSYMAYLRDARGNIVQTVDGTLHTVVRTYSASNRLLTETSYTGLDPDGAGGVLPSGGMTTRYVYDSQDRLTYTVSAEGRVTQYSYTYDLPTMVTTYVDQRFNLAGWAADVAPSAAQMDAWRSAIADKSTVQLHQNWYDGRGNLTRTTEWGAANADGTPSSANDYKTTHYVYDSAGRLLSKTVAGTNPQTFVYDGLGRLISSTDANGATTLTIYRDGLNQVDTVTLPAGGNLVNQSGWPTQPAGSQPVRGPNLVDNSRWPEEVEGPNLIDLANWPGNPASVPGGTATLPTWNNSYTPETQWVSTIGPNGLPVVAMNAGQSDAYDPGGGNQTNLSTYDPTKAYRFTLNFQVTEANKHLVFFGLFGDGANAMVRNGQDGSEDGNPYFTYAIPGSGNSLQAGRWYTMVGYVLPAGAENVAWGSLGGVYDAETGDKVLNVNSFRWNETYTGSKAGVRFFNYYNKEIQGYYTNFYKPEMHQLNFGSGPASIEGWSNVLSYLGETRWTRTTGPDGSPVWAIKTGQLDANEPGGGNHSNAITIDGSKAYEFTYYFKKTDLDSHNIYFGAQDAWDGSSYVRQAWDGGVQHNPYFFSAGTDWQTQNLQSDRWYKVVGYVFPEGSANINTADYGGVYDMTTGQRIASVNNFRWYEGRPSNQVTSRFFNYYGQADQGWSTLFYKPEVREYQGPMPVQAGYAQVPGWYNPGYHVDETNWVRMLGPDGRPVVAIQSGQADYSAEGGGNYTNTATIDPSQAYEFSIYFQLSATDQHHVYLGLTPSYPAYVDQQWSGVASENPYFMYWVPTAAAGYQPGKWYKIVGYVLPQGSALGTASNYGGVYDVATGQKIEAVSNYQWSAGRPDNSVFLRFFNYYEESLQNKSTYFYGASFRPVDDFVQSTFDEATLVRSAHYNRAGELVSLTEAGKNVTGGTATYAYDEAGRLKSATDFRGNTHYYVYDKRGRKTADVAADGTMVEYRYDAEGRQVASVRYYQTLSVGQMQLLRETDGILDVARIRPVASGTVDVWTWTVYDIAGRVLETIQGDGAVTAHEYDGAGRLVRTMGYANKLSSGQIAALIANPVSGVLLPGSSAGDRASRSFFDKDGLLLGTLDGEGYLSRTLYDGAGQVIETIAYANATGTAYRAAGTLDQLATSAGTSGADRHVHFVYDGQGLLRYQIDPLGAVTEYGYVEPYSWAYGRVRSTTRYAGTIALPGTFTLGSVASALSSAGLVGAAGNRTSYNVYDRAGQLIYAIDAAGGVIGHVYDDLGRIVKTIAFAEPRPTSSQPLPGDMEAWAAARAGNAANRVTRAFYNGRGDLLYAIDAEGFVTENRYDADGRVVRTIRYDLKTSISDGATAAVVAAAVASSDYADTQTVYDVQGRVSDQYDAAGTRTWYWYRGNGQLGQVSRAFGTVDQSDIWYFHDAAGRLLVRYDAAGTPEQAITQYEYDGLGDLVSTTDPNFHTTSFDYDRAGRLVRQRNSLAEPTNFTYNAFGERVSVTNARGFSTYSEYDQAGRVTSVVDALNYTTTTRYTAFGEVASVTRGAAVTSFAYDKLGRAVTTTDAEGGVETSGYDAFGNRIRLVNKLGGITDYSYDRRGLLAEERVQAILDGSGNVVTAAFSRNRYEYDARGNVVHRIEAYGLAEQRDSWFEYDKANRLTSKWGEAVSVGLSQAMATPREYYRYDTRGNLVETIDANGARTLSYYDDLDRKVAQVTPAGTAGTQGVLSTFAYDAVGNLTASRTWATLVALPGMAGGTPPGNPGGAYRETVNSYDNLDRLKTTSVANQSVGYWNGSSYAYATGVTLTTSYDYDVVGNVVRTTGPDGAVVHSYYDALDRKTAQVDAGSWLTTWSYDAEGNVLSEWRYAGQATGVSIAGYGAPGTQGDDRVTNFAYDKMGRRIRESRWLVETWSLNAANGQLVGGGGRWADIQYSYNALGEVRTKTEATGDVTTYSYDNAGRLIQEARPGFNGVTPTVRYQYNGLGQLTVTRQGDASLSGNDRISTNLYDGAGRLTGVSDALGQTRSYYYDAAGRKVGEYYTRELGNGGSLGAGTLVTEGISYQYDLAGNVVRQAINTIAGGSWSEVSSTQSAYDAFGAITARGTNGGWQEQFRYDTAGHLVASNAGDGVWRIHAYDKAGRQTLAIESNGSTDLSGLSQASAIALIAGGTVTASATVYDGRGQAVQAVQIQRQTAVGGAVQNIATARGYTAFGELAWETDAYGRQTDYSYNTMGRVTQIQRPSVSVTAENGTVSSTRPTERMFYDISGRLIGTQDANSVWTGSGVKTTRQLLAGTGYGDGAALMVREWHPDGGIVANSYDVFGDQVDSWDALNRHTSMAYDKLGRLTQVTRPATAAGTLVQSYAYDVLGNRIGAWNNAVGYAGRERTQYDALGRITLQVAFGGDTTTTSYGWDGAMATSGLGTFGGWVATSSYANGMTSVARTDLQGRLTSKTDLGGHVTSAGYDLAGRMTSRTTTGAHGTESASYAWLNNGQIGSMSTSAGGITTTQSSSYDLSGNKLAEYSTRAGVVIQNATATYDALNRLVTWSESGSDASITPAASSTYEYDANSNVMRTLSSFRYLDQNGAALGFVATKDDVYRYDTMNRMVRGGGVDIAYDVAGQRVRVATWSDGLTWTGWRARAPGSGQIVLADDPSMYEWQGYNWTPAGRATYSGQVVETYSYTADGQLDQVWVSAEQASANGGPFVQANGTFGPAVRRAAFAYDLQGRLTGQTDYEADGTTVAYSRSELWYDAAGRLYHEMQVVRQGADTLLTYLDTGYGAGTGGYALGAVTSVSAVTFKNGSNSAVPDTLTTNGFAWFDGAVQASVAYKPDASGSSVFTTSYGLSAGGLTNSAYIADGRPREVRFVLDAAGQAIRRDEADNNPSLGDPHQLWYRFNGREMGNVTNDNVDAAYLSSIASRQTAAGTGAFRNGALTGGGRAVFGEAYRALTSYSQGGAGGSYEAQGGETLEGVAAQLWGDGALWYRLAEANGLSVSATLVAGQRLTIPAGVMRSSNSAATFKPYDPAEALGSLSPTTPKPAQKGNKCGALGAILMAAVAVAITLLIKAPVAEFMSSLLGTTSAVAGSAAAVATGVAAGAVVGAAASAGSQIFGLVTGIQDKFNWKNVALAGISAGVAAGLAGSFGEVAGSPFLGDAVRGALGSAIGQGIGVATGLQSKFDFAGVAAAGLGMGASGAIGLGGFEGRLLSNTAGGLANAAARSLLDGTSFGDNILAALPDIIGQTIGGMVADQVAGSGKMSPGERALVAEAENSANAVTAAEANRGYVVRAVAGAVANGASPNATDKGSDNDTEIVVTGKKLSDAAYMPASYNQIAQVAGAKSITVDRLTGGRLKIGNGIYTASAILEIARSYSEKYQIDNVISRFGLSSDSASDVLSASAYVWGQYRLPAMSDQIGFSGPTLDNASQALMRVTMIDPSIFINALSGSSYNQQLLWYAAVGAATGSISRARPQGVEPALQTSSRAARAAIAANLLSGKWQAHHLIPAEIWGANPGIARLARQQGWNQDGPSNLIALPADAAAQASTALTLPIHNGSHPRYNLAVGVEIQTYIASAGGRLNAYQARGVMELISARQRVGILTGQWNPRVN